MSCLVIQPMGLEYFTMHLGRCFTTQGSMYTIGISMNIHEIPSTHPDRSSLVTGDLVRASTLPRPPRTPPGPVRDRRPRHSRAPRPPFHRPTNPAHRYQQSSPQRGARRESNRAVMGGIWWYIGGHFWVERKAVFSGGTANMVFP